MTRVAQRKQQLVEAKANRRWNRTKSKSMEKSSTDKKRAAISQIRKRPSATQRAASTKDLYHHRERRTWVIRTTKQPDKAKRCRVIPKKRPKRQTKKQHFELLCGPALVAQSKATEQQPPVSKLQGC